MGDKEAAVNTGNATQSENREQVLPTAMPRNNSRIFIGQRFFVDTEFLRDRRTNTLKKLTINRNTVSYKFKKVPYAETGRCTICLGEFTENECVRRLPCLHIYHINCIDDWLIQSSMCIHCMHCPCCRRNVVQPEMDF